MPGYDINDLKRRMDSSIDVLKKEFSGIRSGRANVNFLEPVSVNAYGQTMKLRDLSTVSAPEARMINIQVWDSANVSVVEKAIHEADLGLNPQVEGEFIRIILPELTEERRLELAKTVSKYAEQAKVSVRNVRQDGMNSLKRDSQEGTFSDDEQKSESSAIQQLTDEKTNLIDDLAKSKTTDIKQV